MNELCQARGKKTTCGISGERGPHPIPIVTIPIPVPSPSHPHRRCGGLEPYRSPPPPPTGRLRGHSPPSPRRLSRRNWPLERCWSPKLRAILSHTVPFPEPGGPSTTARSSLEAIAGCRRPARVPAGQDSASDGAGPPRRAVPSRAAPPASSRRRGPYTSAGRGGAPAGRAARPPAPSGRGTLGLVVPNEPRPDGSPLLGTTRPPRPASGAGGAEPGREVCKRQPRLSGRAARVVHGGRCAGADTGGDPQRPHGHGRAAHGHLAPRTGCSSR